MEFFRKLHLFKHNSFFRKECIFTIDPATARDLDDALSCKLLSDGVFPYSEFEHLCFKCFQFLSFLFFLV